MTQTSRSAEAAIFEIRRILVDKVTTVHEATTVLAWAFRLSISKDDADVALDYFENLVPQLYDKVEDEQCGIMTSQ